MFYDHFLTLDEEIDFVWLYSASVGYFSMDGQALFSLLVYKMRLWAVYRSLKLLIVMGVVILIGLAAMGAIQGVSDTRVTGSVHNTAISGHVKICAPSGIPPFAYVFWIPPIIIETISVILVLFKAVRHVQGGAPKEWAGSRFMELIARYSVIYFILVLTIPAFELFIPLTFALPAIAGNRMLLTLRGIFYSDHSLVPGQEHIGMKTVVNQYESGVTVEAQYNPYKEFESFFGDNRGSKGSILPGFSIKG
ncbi:hypothetical protein BU17DRAFT_59896 [Hysterangium stoloniferum]|nr:hypothetical protein BU17DRAFT_59896 [Hysterangium stoloniferum]